MASRPFNKKPWAKKPNKPIPKKNVHIYGAVPSHGYQGYQLYFPDPTEDKAPKIVKIVQCFEGFINANKSQFPKSTITENLSFQVDLKSLLSYEEFKTDWPKLKDEIINDTEFCLSCMGLAMHYIISKDNTIQDVPLINCRLFNHEPVLQLKNLRVNSYGTFVSIRGTVIKASTVKLICHHLKFICSSCSGTQVIRQIDGVYTSPSQCLSDGCKAYSNFCPILQSADTKTLHFQTIKLQELIGEEEGEQGRVPRTIECELTHELVGCCIPGDDITISGVVKVQRTEVLNVKNKQPNIFQLYLDVNSIINEKTGSKESKSQLRVHLNKSDYYAIQKIYGEPSLFRLLVQSLCPNIYGHELVKAGLILALFGGSGLESDTNIRADSHVLMVGDPGLGKSQLLQACNNVAPRGVYVCGNTSTTSGLTVTMTRERGSEYALEAGALVLADQGCCCIDEFDKMSSQHNCLLEVMEQQTISIAKAGVRYSLPTSATILAAANPVGGHYNKSKTVAENLKMGSPLLSRFDLVFILLDQPNEQMDMLLSEHVLALHFGRKSKFSSSSTASVSSTASINTNLKNRLKLQPGESLENLPHVLLRKYIAYAQKYVHPKITKEAQTVLKQFYVDLRKQYHKSDGTPVTTRQLESVLRLTQARAKLELREEATVDDAIDVLEIMRHSLLDIFSDEFGGLDFSRSQNGSGVSNKKTITQFIRVLKHKSELLSTSTFKKSEMKDLALQCGVDQTKFNDFLESLNIQGFLLKKGGDKYQLGIV